jgi:dUTP pyrophosphatase
MTSSHPAIDVVQLDHAKNLPLPAYETADAAGMDVRAALSESVTLAPGERKAIPTGLKLAIPSGYEVQVRPRSGLAIKKGITMINAPGTVDADFRGEVHVLMVNHSDEPFVVEHGERIAQLVVAPVVQATWNVVDALDETARGEGGFGSTGVK